MEDFEWTEYQLNLEQFVLVIRDSDLAGLIEYMNTSKTFELKMIWSGDIYVSGICAAIRFRKTDALRHLLTFVDTIPIDVLEDRCSGGSIRYICEIVDLLLKHGKFSQDPSYIVPKMGNINLNNRLQTLLDEYRFRLDGPVYNENVL